MVYVKYEKFICNQEMRTEKQQNNKNSIDNVTLD